MRLGSPGIRNTNNCVYIPERTFQKLVGQDTRSIIEAKETMVRKNCPYPKVMGVEYAFMRQ